MLNLTERLTFSPDNYRLSVRNDLETMFVFEFQNKIEIAVSLIFGDRPASIDFSFLTRQWYDIISIPLKSINYPALFTGLNPEKCTLYPMFHPDKSEVDLRKKYLVGHIKLYFTYREYCEGC